MLTHLLAFALNRPRAVEAAGKLVVRVAGFAIAAGFIFKAVAGILGSLPGARAPVTAQEVLPGVPMWWLPETTAGILAWGLALGIGIAAVVAGRQLLRELRAYR